MRTIIRFLFFALFLGSVYFPTVPMGVAFPARMEPLTTVMALFGGVNILNLLGGITVLILSLFIRRFFCRWLCPLGLILDGCRTCRRHCGRIEVHGGRIMPLFPWVGRLLFALLFFTFLTGGFGLGWLAPTTLTASLVGGGTTLPLVTAVGLIALTFLIPGAWCGGLCPTGVFSEFLGRIPRRMVFFTFFTRKKDRAKTVPTPAPRRRFFRQAGVWTFFLSVTTGGLFGLKRLGASTVKRPIRPPGGLEEPFFSSGCIRCGACLRSCPTGLLRPVRRRDSFDTPEADFRFGWCRPDCQRCAEVCPTGVITLKLPEEKKAATMAVIRLDLQGCRLWHEKECSACLRECPAGAITFAWDEEEYLNLPVIDMVRCNGCGRCVFVCPGVEGQKGFTAEPPAES